MFLLKSLKNGYGKQASEICVWKSKFHRLGTVFVKFLFWQRFAKIWWLHLSHYFKSEGVRFTVSGSIYLSCKARSISGPYFSKASIYGVIPPNFSLGYELMWSTHFRTSHWVRCSVQTTAFFFYKILADLITFHTWWAFRVTNKKLITCIGFTASKAFGTKVVWIVKYPFGMNVIYSM